MLVRGPIESEANEYICMIQFIQMKGKKANCRIILQLNYGKESKQQNMCSLAFYIGFVLPKQRETKLNIEKQTNKAPKPRFRKSIAKCSKIYITKHNSQIQAYECT